MIRSLRNQAGVAMVTVLLVGAVLTVLATTATFVTIQELEASGEDSQAGQALSFAEAGVDRMLFAIASEGRYVWGQLMQSSCSGSSLAPLTGNVGNGSFAVAVKAETCPNPVPNPFEPQFVNITACGGPGTVALDVSNMNCSGGTGALRKIRQRIKIVSGGLPIGVFSFHVVNISGLGNGTMEGISLITPDAINNRDKLEFSGYDPWYTQDQLYGNGITTKCDGVAFPVTSCTSANSLPAAPHAGGVITCNGPKVCGDGTNKTEHTPPAVLSADGGASPSNLATSDNLNCTANANGTLMQSSWDGSINGGSTAGLSCVGSTLGKAPTSAFSPAQALSLEPKPELTEDDYQRLKQGAASTGIYCTGANANSMTCTKKGVAFSANGLNIGANDLVGMPNTYIVYIEFPANSTPKDTAHTLTWDAIAGPCSTDPNVTKSTVIIIRNGSIDVRGGQQNQNPPSGVAGAILAREGKITVNGGALIHGSMIGDELELKGNSRFRMDPCALQNLTVPFISVSAASWQEIDR